ncbi:MAG: TraR/DksA C4-type zinc finger protein [Planctomycetales bacterium]|nr:TraR/DksA C4-type zinc finger protein [Planctomycetales bacterium]
MTLPPRFIRLSCSQCEGSETLPWEDFLTRLRGSGKFRRNHAPTWEEVASIVEISSEATGCCPTCGLAWTSAAPWTPLDDFESHRRCDVCESIIDAERLEALPETDLCRECASQGGSKADYCPLCGAVTRWDRRTVGNRYRQCCDACGWAG